MASNLSLITRNPATERFREIEDERAARVSRETAEQQLTDLEEMRNRGAPVDAAAGAAVRTAGTPAARGRGLQDIFATEAVGRGLGREGFEAASGAAQARTEQDAANFEQFVGALGAGDVATAQLIAQQNGRQVSPQMQQALADVNFQKGMVRLWEQSKEIFKNQPQAMSDALKRGMQQLLEAQAAGSTSPVQFDRPAGAAVTPSVGGQDQDFQILQDAQGNFFRVNKQTGQVEPLSVGGEQLAGQPKGQTQRDRDVASLKARGLTDQEAQDVAAGRIRVSSDPVTGQLRLVNVATGEVTFPGGAFQGAQGGQTPAGVGSAQSQRSTQPDTIFGSLEDTFGAVNALQAVGSGIAGQLGLPRAEDEVRARAQLRKLSQEIRSALSLSNRPPVFEQKLILENIPSVIANDPETAAINLSTLHAQLLANLKDDQAYSQRPDVPPDGREAAFRRIRAIEAVLRTLGDPPIRHMNVDQVLDAMSRFPDEQLDELEARYFELVR